MNPCVLVVDPSPSRLRSLRQRFADLGFEVRTAHTAHTALHLMSMGSFDLVAADWFIEDMLLHDFADRAKRTQKDCALLVLFDQSSPTRPRGLDYPRVDGWVPHSASDNTFRQTVASVVGSRRRSLSL